MLEFNSDHKAADFSSIMEQLQKAKKIGSTIICGITLSAALLLSGCAGNAMAKNQSADVPQPVNMSTAIVMENGNALIVDLKSYNKYSADLMSVKSYDLIGEDRTWILYTVSGDTLLVDYESVQIINGADSHAKAEAVAQALVDDDGTITCYDDAQSYENTK